MTKRAWDQTSGVALAALMKRNNVSVVQLAQACSVKHQAVVDWQRGKEPSQGHLAILDQVLDLTPDDYKLLYPLTSAQKARQVERERTKAAVLDGLADLEHEGWQPR